MIALIGGYFKKTSKLTGFSTLEYLKLGKIANLALANGLVFESIVSIVLTNECLESVRISNTNAASETLRVIVPAEAVPVPSFHELPSLNYLIF